MRRCPLPETCMEHATPLQDALLGALELTALEPDPRIVQIIAVQPRTTTHPEVSRRSALYPPGPIHRLIMVIGWQMALCGTAARSIGE